MKDKRERKNIYTEKGFILYLFFFLSIVDTITDVPSLPSGHHHTAVYVCGLWDKAFGLEILKESGE